MVAIETDAALTRGSLTIDHHPEGLGFVTRYLHVTDILVAEGAFVQKGTAVAAVSAEPEEPHLHFELWAVVDRESAREPGWPGDTDMVPVTATAPLSRSPRACPVAAWRRRRSPSIPTRTLYDWERRTGVEGEPIGPAPVAGIGLVRRFAIPFLAADLATDPPARVHVPMYEPMTEDERLAIDLLRDAHGEGVDVTVRPRASAFWGVDVVSQIELGMR